MIFVYCYAVLSTWNACNARINIPSFKTNFVCSVEYKSDNTVCEGCSSEGWGKSTGSCTYVELSSKEFTTFNFLYASLDFYV